MSGMALRITDDAGAVESLAKPPFWISKMMNFLQLGLRPRVRRGEPAHSMGRLFVAGRARRH
jgi:hypothetical protein